MDTEELHWSGTPVLEQTTSTSKTLTQNPLRPWNHGRQPSYHTAKHEWWWNSRFQLYSAVYEACARYCSDTLTSNWWEAIQITDPRLGIVLCGGDQRYSPHSEWCFFVLFDSPWLQFDSRRLLRHRPPTPGLWSHIIERHLNRFIALRLGLPESVCIFSGCNSIGDFCWLWLNWCGTCEERMLSSH